MKIESTENLRVSNTLEIEDALKENKSISLKIDAAHAGTLNGNFLFYTPKALSKGSLSLKKFYKPLQKAHYDKTLGYIYDSSYEPLDTSSKYYKGIVEAENPKDLVDTVKKYIRSRDYKNSPGFGVLTAKAKLYDKKKIDAFKNNDIGTVSVGGDCTQAYCSICYNHIAECGHKLGHRYDGETCIGIVADDLEVDHISFEAIPANWETKSLVIQDSQLTGTLEILTEEGHPMNLTLNELREKLAGSIEEVLKELDLVSYLEQYVQDTKSARKSSFLLASDKLLPTNTPLTIYVAQKLISQLEESEDKEVVVSALGSLYTDLFDGKTEEEVKSILEGTSQEKVEEVIIEAVKGDPEKAESGEKGGATREATTEVEGAEEGASLSISDSDKIALAITDKLNLAIDEKLTALVSQLSEVFTKDASAKANRILEERIEAFKADLDTAEVYKNQITDELKESLLNQILLLTKGTVERESDYFKKLMNRSIQELKNTLEDHLELFGKSSTVEVTQPEVTPVLQVADSNQFQKIDVTDASNAMEDNAEDQKALEIEDSDKVISEVVNSLPEGKLSKAAYTKLYKDVYFKHGSVAAKKLQPVLKQNNKI